MSKLRILISAAGVILSVCPVVAETYDLVVYGSSPAAISTAVQAKRMGKSAVIVSPETRIGGHQPLREAGRPEVGSSAERRAV